tara:strand:- start:10054 stop:10680 length:627 start_codon:yes stop_codon:yes gene_type:complete
MNKLIIIILTTLSSTIFAQDYDAKKILDKLSNKTKSYENIKINFNFILENQSQNIKESQKGTLILAKEKFKLTMNNQIIINDGETQWIYLADVNEVQIIEHDPDDQMMTPNKIFTIYEEGYKYKYINQQNITGEITHNIDLFPEESLDFIRINIAINDARSELERITIYDKNGGSYTYIVQKLESNNKLPEFIFNAAEFPGVEIIDLR